MKIKKDFPPGQLYRSSEKFDSTEFHNYQQQGLLLAISTTKYKKYKYFIILITYLNTYLILFLFYI